MTTFEITNPDSQLTILLDRVANGEEVVLTRDGHELARVSPVGQNPKPKRIGFLEGKIQVSHDFDTTSQEILDSFHTPLFPQGKS
jgi:antitoxin (DNA-binding transcriptional repressor) of toxin-antitoxin stability system